jgi:hypothetical protein
MRFEPQRARLLGGAALLILCAAGCNLQPLRRGDIFGGGAQGVDTAASGPALCTPLVTGFADASTAAASSTSDDTGSGVDADAASAAGVGASGDNLCPAFEAPWGLDCGDMRDGDECSPLEADPTCNKKCHKSCGPSKTGMENCQCTTCGGSGEPAYCLRCRPCGFGPANHDHNYQCFALPAVMPSCMPLGEDGKPLILVQSGDVCTAAPCKPCGSRTVDTFLDRAPAKKTGYCVCDAISGKWSCARPDDWPQPCLTNPQP